MPILLDARTRRMRAHLTRPARADRTAYWRPTILLASALAVAVTGCRKPEPVDELEGVEPWKSAIFCSAAIERNGKLLALLARSSDDIVEQKDLLREAKDRRESALAFGRRGKALAEEAGVEHNAIRAALLESDMLFEDMMESSPSIEDYAAQLADRVRFCEDTVMRNI